MAVVCLVSCVGKKQRTQTAAENLYTSDWFKKAKAFAQVRSDIWYILSAKYGLLRPDDIIEFYEQNLGCRPKHERLNWAKQVLESIVEITAKGDHIIMLAGARYREHLVEALLELSYTVDVPLAGKGIGEQLNWLGKQVN